MCDKLKTTFSLSPTARAKCSMKFLKQRWSHFSQYHWFNMRSNEDSIVPPASPAQLVAHNKLVLVRSVTDCCHTPKGYLCTYSPVVHGRREKSTVITTSVLHLDGHVIILRPRHLMGAISRYVQFLHLSSIFFCGIFSHATTQKGISWCRFSGKFTISL
jgi:hypothetical protein